MQADDVRLGEQRARSCTRRPRPCGKDLIGHVRVVGDDPHTKRPQQRGHAAANLAEADQPDGLPLQLVGRGIPEVQLAAPEALGQGLVATRQVTTLGDNQAQGKLGNSLRIAAGGIENRDAAAVAAGTSMLTGSVRVQPMARRCGSWARTVALIGGT